MACKSATFDLDSGQISIFDIFNVAKADRKKCYHCLYYESHRCRNNKDCPKGISFEEYAGSTVRQCIYATVEIFQDGYIHCPVLDCIGCEKCMEMFGNGENFIPDESQNYERVPKWVEQADALYYT